MKQFAARMRIATAPGWSQTWRTSNGIRTAVAKTISSLGPASLKIDADAFREEDRREKERDKTGHLKNPPATTSCNLFRR